MGVDPEEVGNHGDAEVIKLTDNI